MTAIVVNTNATIKGVDSSGVATPGAATLGGMIYQLATLAVMGQKNIAINPQALDYISLSEDREASISGVTGNNGGVATIDFSPPCRTVTLPFTQSTTIVVPDYFTSPSIGYTAGSGGSPTFTSGNWATDLFDAIRLMNWLQISLDKNPSNLSLVSSWQISSASAVGTLLDSQLQASVSIPLQAISDTLGGWRYIGLSPFGALS